jgi:hypothetical protein
MRSVKFSWKKILTVAGVAFLAAAGAYGDEAATATYTDTQVSPGVFQYDLTLKDTGSTTIGTFWFSWIPGNGFLPAAATNVTMPAGWNSQLTNGAHAIQFTTGSPISAGSTVTGFEFESTTTPAQMLALFGGPAPGIGDPVSTFFTYSSAPFSDAGFQGVAKPFATTPEPATITFLAFAIGLLGLGVTKVKRTIA